MDRMLGDPSRRTGFSRAIGSPFLDGQAMLVGIIEPVLGTECSWFLEPISKSLEEDNEASELYEAEEVLGVVFPTDEDAALPLNPSKEALHEPASHIAA